MTEETDSVADLLYFAASDRRVCPQPQRWNELWQMLPSRERKGDNWVPALPLILWAWWEATDQQKQDRLAEHICFAAKHGAFEKVNQFLRSLSAEEWSYNGNT